MKAFKLRELIAKATPGPWKIIKSSDGQRIWGSVWAKDGEEDFCVVDEQCDSGNAELVAHLANNAEAIAELIEAAESVANPQSYRDHLSSHTELREALAKIKE